MASLSSNSWELLGPKEIYIDGFLFGSEYVAAEAGELTIEESELELASQSGTTNLPTGTYSNMSATVNLLIPNFRTLQYIWPDLFEPGDSLTEEDTDWYGDGVPAGRIVIGSGTCKTTTAKEVIIHYACAEDSRNDIRFPQAMISNSSSFNFDSMQAIAITIAPIPGTEGAIILGEGNLEGPSLYDPDTMTYKLLSES